MGTRISESTRRRANALAIRRSTEAEIVKPAEILREAIDVGLSVMESEPKKT